MRRFGSYALIATYMVVQLFGQVIHAWSGCEHAHLPGHFHSVAAVDHDDHSHSHSHYHHHHNADSSEAPAGPGWNDTDHQHGIVVDGCLLCQHLALGQIAPATAETATQAVVLDQLIPYSERLATQKWLGPNSPRAPPVA
ncbi:hypothetical protein AB1L30_20595 [Bremerella sp. JC817]|uniref:hypothetical protein n=1 Tax=Bremerella sp. JC817 TaxID=3231756 RepID=UPI003459CBD4